MRRWPSGSRLRPGLSTRTGLARVLRNGWLDLRQPMQSTFKNCSPPIQLSARCSKASRKARRICGSWRVLEPARLLRLLQSDPDEHLTSLLAQHGRDAGSSGDAADAMRLLRRMKAEGALLIALADIGGVWPVMRAARALTELADAAVDAAVRFILAEAGRDGRLKLADIARPEVGSGYVVLAMGKMGAFELNYSSDIDLIVLYEPTAPALPADAEPSTLYVRLTQRLVKLLQERTADGYVFRTDLRLRPDPASTTIAISTPAAVSYYESAGQNWERAAMIKARPCAGDLVRRGEDSQRNRTIRVAEVSRLCRRQRRACDETSNQRLPRPW